MLFEGEVVVPVDVKARRDEQRHAFAECLHAAGLEQVDGALRALDEKGKIPLGVLAVLPLPPQCGGVLALHPDLITNDGQCVAGMSHDRYSSLNSF